MRVGFHELVIEEQEPDFLHQLVFEKAEHCRAGWKSIRRRIRIDEFIGKLYMLLSETGRLEHVMIRTDGR